MSLWVVVVVKVPSLLSQQHCVRRKDLPLLQNSTTENVLCPYLSLLLRKTVSRLQLFLLISIDLSNTDLSVSY